MSDTAIAAIFGGGFVAVIEVVKMVLDRFFKKSDANAEIIRRIDANETRIVEGLRETNRKITDLHEEVNERWATDARIRILRFADELMAGTHHSKESFDQTLADIDVYEDYCEGHPLYSNNRTELANERIRKSYAECMEKNNFL